MTDHPDLREAGPEAGVSEEAPDPTTGGAEAPEAAEQGEPTPEQLATRVTELTADLQRLQAEYVNYKRRVDRDRDLVMKNARFTSLAALLPVLDAIDRAREHEELSGGFKAIAESLERIVAGEGLLKFGEPGDEFDPRVHEALAHSHSSHVTTTTCDKVVQSGYRIGDRVVRPALVTVVDPEISVAEVETPPAQPDGGSEARDEPATEPAREDDEPA